MSTIDLDDAKVSYDGQTLPAMKLLARLQAQLQETTCRLATIAATLGDLQTALLNSETIEVKLTLSREDLGRLRAIGGASDSERIRRAVLASLHPETAGEEPPPPRQNAALEKAPGGFSTPGTAPGDPQRAELEPVSGTPPHPQGAEMPPARRATANCPTCKSAIDLPEAADRWSVEIRCGSCGAKSLVKPRVGGNGKVHGASPSTEDGSAYRKLFDTLSV